jgi:hypothetical protein
MTDHVIAKIGRRLAEALSKYAYERSDDAKKQVAAIQTELCAAAREELEIANREGEKVSE